MGRIRGFVLSYFGKHYLLIFLPFFSILSIVYIIRISILSNRIALDAGEILTLYGFFLPDILFYTLPLSFVVAVATALTKLSEDNELITLFSFGMRPVALLRIFALPVLLFVSLMLILSLRIIPQSTADYKRFESDKEAEAELTIVPNRLGEKFGDYSVFLGGKEGDLYRDVVLFATDNKAKRVLIMANRGEMKREHGQFSLNLYQGSGDTFLSDRIESIRYDQLRIYNTIRHTINTQWLNRGWSRISTSPSDMALFVYNIFLSLSPLLVLGLLIAFSVINPRYQRSHAYLVSFGVILAIYLAASLLKKEGTPLLLLLVSLLFFGASILFFSSRSKARF